MIRLILLVVIFILLLSFFGVSIKALVNSPLTQENFAFVWQLILTGWQYLQQQIQNTSFTLPFAVHGS